MNVSSLLAHVEEVHEFLLRKKPLALLVSETCLTDEINDNEIECEGYRCFRNNSHSRYTGGCCIYVRSDVRSEIVNSSTLSEKVWILSVKVYDGNDEYMFTSVYFSPNGGKRVCLEFFDDWCENNVYMTAKHVICGDFNIDLLKYGTYQTKIKQLITSYGMKQYVNEPTRITASSRTKIDLVMSSVRVEAEPLLTDKISDHSTIQINVDGLVCEREMKKTVKKLVNYTPESYRRLLAEFDWKSLSGRSVTLNEKSECLNEQLINSLKTFVKEVKVTTRSAKKWFDEELSEMRIKKEMLYATAVHQPTDRNWSNYKNWRNSYQTAIRSKRQSYNEKKLDKASGNSKETWKILKTLLNGKRCSEIGTVNINGVDIQDANEIADKINEFYVNSVVDINRGIEESNMEENGEVQDAQTLPCFELEKVNVKYLEKCLMEMNNKKDVDLISPKILLDAWPIIAETVCSIVNHSLDETLPDVWKVATIAPVPKVSQPKKAEEYRPVNMLPTFEKLIETVVKNQLISYIEKHDILSKFQSGYRARHSCETALNLVMAKWKDISSNGDIILAVFLDLKRAFETIDRERLIRKLKSFGFSTKALTWFEGYLNNRRQRTKVNGHTSNTIPNNLGVPQGSVLGAILFILYINDLPSHLTNVFINLFADDTLIYLHGSNIDELSNRMNAELDKINQWLRLNKLKLNASKTKVMVIRHPSMASPVNRIMVDGEDLEMVNHIKYLGVMIDHKIDFKENVDYVCKKVAKKVGVLSRLASNLTIAARISIYKAIIAPHFDYCSSILFLSDQSAFDRLQKLQNRAMRAVLKCRRLTPISFMLEALDWLNVKQRVYATTLTFVYKLRRGLLPQYLGEMVTYNGEIHQYSTRSRSDFHVPMRKSAKQGNSLFHRGLILFNSLPRDLKGESSEAVFKSKLRRFVRTII